MSREVFLLLKKGLGVLCYQYDYDNATKNLVMIYLQTKIL